MKKLSFLFVVVFVLLLYVQAFAEQVADEVVAIVNDHIITDFEVEKAIMPFYAQLNKLYSGQELQDKLNEARARALNSLVEDRLLLDKSQEYDIKIDDLRVTEKIEDMKKKFPSEEIFQQALLKEGVSERELEDKYREQMRVQALVHGRIGSMSKATFKETYDYYEAHKDEYAREDDYSIGHILLRWDAERDKEKTYEQALKVRGLLMDGESFESLAKEFSQGPYASKGGLMDSVKPGSLKAELNNALLNLKEGDVSDVIETDIGYHIIKLYKFRHSELIPFEDVEKDIKLKVETEKFKQEYRSWIKQLREEAYVEIKKEY